MKENQNTAKVNERAIVLDILLEVLEDGRYSHILIGSVLEKYAFLDKKSRAFIQKLSYGVIERQLTLDYIINQFSNTKTNKMKPVIRNILRMGVYQIYYMDGVPDSAACNEAVKLANKKGFRNLSGFVNGVLRNIARADRISGYPNLSIQYSIPEWIVDELINKYGVDNVHNILSSYLKAKPVTIRVNQTKTTTEALIERLAKEGVTAKKISDLAVDKDKGLEISYPSYALQISGFDSIRRLQSFQEGLFYIQDLSSMMVSHLGLYYDRKKSEVGDGDFKALDLFTSTGGKAIKVLDLCAAPGGKAIHMAELLEVELLKAKLPEAEYGKEKTNITENEADNQKLTSVLSSAYVLARDLTEKKVALINENIKRTGLENITAQAFDATLLDSEAIGKYDIVIADLPCSGLGIIGRKPDIKYRVNKEDIYELQKLQRKMLDNAMQYVKPGGRLLYSTCTILAAENEENAAYITEQDPSFQMIFEKTFLPNDLQDGFFISIFEK